MADTLRAFFALPVREADRSALLDAQRRMKRAAEGGRISPRWSAAEQLHVTVKFLGDVDARVVSALLAIGARRAAEHAPLSPVWSEMTGFGIVQRARVLVATVSDANGDMARLSADVDADVEPLGIPRETRAFIGHVTLGRLRHQADVRALVDAAKLEPAPAHFDELVLYRSELGPEGAVYTALSRWNLGPESAP